MILISSIETKKQLFLLWKYFSCMINPNFQTSGPPAEQVPGRGGLPSSLFRRITQQYILPLEYAISANFLLFEAISQLDNLSINDDLVNLFQALEGKSVSWLLARVMYQSIPSLTISLGDPRDSHAFTAPGVGLSPCFLCSRRSGF